MKKTLNKDIILDTINQQHENIRQFGINKVGLFGSYARDEQTEKSDIDFIVEFDEGQKTFKNYMGFIDFSENIFKKSVDLVTFDTAKHRLLKYIQDEIKYAQI